MTIPITDEQLILILEALRIASDYHQGVAALLASGRPEVMEASAQSSQTVPLLQALKTQLRAAYDQRQPTALELGPADQALH